MSTTLGLIPLVLAWILYFVIHSLLASLRVKQGIARRLPSIMPWYRLLFNLQASILIVAPLYLLWLYRSEPLWQWRGAMAWLAYGLMLCALAGFVWSMRYYDSGEFLGIRQLQRRQGETNDRERLRISPLHRFVRHPWYSLGLVLIWTQDMDPARLVSALAVTGYLMLGSYLEEAKLLVYHGELYERYRRRVPGLVPRPWRFLKASQARELNLNSDD